MLVAYNIHQGPSNPINIYQIAPTDSENKLRVGKRNISLAIINPISLQSSSVATQRSHSPIVQVHNVVQPPGFEFPTHPELTNELPSGRDSPYTAWRAFFARASARESSQSLAVVSREKLGVTRSSEFLPTHSLLHLLCLPTTTTAAECWTKTDFGQPVRQYQSTVGSGRRDPQPGQDHYA